MSGSTALWLATLTVAFAQQPNTVSPQEQAEGFKLIFDGRTLDGWHAGKNNWVVQDGALHLKEKGGSIAWIAQKLPDDFELRFEWMVDPGGNSGVHYRGGQFEYQILDNRSEPHYKSADSAGAIYSIAGPPTDISKPALEWNTGCMLAHGNRIQHWLNGQLVADVNLASPEWAGILEKERQRRIQIPAPGPSREGYLTLSYHTNAASFRSIRLRFLPATDIGWKHLSTRNGDLPTPNAGTQQTSATVFDIDGDGINDFVITERTAAPAAVWYRRTPKGWSRYVIEAGPLHIEAGSTFADVDGDGHIDFVAGGDYKSNEVWWWENPGPPYDPVVPWKRHVIKNTGAVKHHDQIFADVDGDGKPEFFFWNQNARKLFFARIPRDPRNTGPWQLHEVYSYPGDGEMEQRGKAPGMVNEHEGLAVADIDGDGKPDIIGGGRWFKYIGDNRFEAHIIDAGYQFTRAAAGQLIEGGRPEVVLVSGDGEGPLLMYQWVKGVWRSRKIADIRNGHSLAMVDFDRDGHLDIFCAEMRLNGANPDAKAYVFLGDGKGNFKTVVLNQGYGNHESKLADLDGDGTLDILGKPYNWETPRLDIWLNRK